MLWSGGGRICSFFFFSSRRRHTRCGRDWSSDVCSSDLRKHIAIAIHRAISELAATIVRSHQLYCPSPAHSWLECHRLYRFACRNKLADHDEIGRASCRERVSSSVLAVPVMQKHTRIVAY